MMIGRYTWRTFVNGVAAAIALAAIVSALATGCDSGSVEAPGHPQVAVDFDDIPPAAKSMMVDAYAAATAEADTMTLLQAAVVLAKSDLVKPVYIEPENGDWSSYTVVANAGATSSPVWVAVFGAELRWWGWHESDPPGLVEEMVTYWADGDTIRGVAPNTYSDVGDGLPE